MLGTPSDTPNVAKSPAKVESPSKVDLVESLVHYTEGWDYERELDEKVKFVKSKFPEIRSLQEQDKVQFFRSPTRHFRFRTAINVIPPKVLTSQILSNENRRSWLEAIYYGDTAERRRCEELDNEKSEIGKGHFVIFDASLVKKNFSAPDSASTAGNNSSSDSNPAYNSAADSNSANSDPSDHSELVVRDLEPERMCLETLSRGIVNFLRDPAFLKQLCEEFYTKNRGLVVIKLHSTVLNEDAIIRGEKGVPGGVICSFILNDPDAFDQVSLSTLSQLFPHVRFVVQAKNKAKSVLGNSDVSFSGENQSAIKSASRADLDGSDDRSGSDDLSANTSGSDQSQIMTSKQVIQSCTLDEHLTISGRSCKYTQIFDSFSNPNPYIAISTGEWLHGLVGKYGADTDANLLELFCGIGSHTIVLGHCFRNIVAVEIDPNLVQMLKDNVRKNGDYFLCDDDSGSESYESNKPELEDNRTRIYPIRAPSERFCRSIMKARCYSYSKKDGSEKKSLTFDWILVDPPRAGLDSITLKSILNYPHILYISCNPAALRRDLDYLLPHFELVEFCLLDHFPYTPHVENGVYLRKKKSY